LQNRSLPHVEGFIQIFAGHFFTFSPRSTSRRVGRRSGRIGQRDSAAGPLAVQDELKFLRLGLDAHKRPVKFFADAAGVFSGLSH
jgi:hypothetical protein